MASLRSLVGVLLVALSSAAFAQVELLYVSAPDCGFCRRWEAQYLQDRQPKNALDWRDVRFTVVDLRSFRSRFGVNDAPPRLRPGMAKAMEAAGQLSLFGTPWFALFVDGEVRVHAFGLSAFENRIQPAMKAALREKAPART